MTRQLDNEWTKVYDYQKTDSWDKQCVTVKIYNHNEVISLRVMGYSNIQIILIPALTSFIIGYIVVFLIVPFSSSMLRYYEDLRSEYNETKNLVFVNESGIWILDKNEKEENSLYMKIPLS